MLLISTHQYYLKIHKIILLKKSIFYKNTSNHKNKRAGQKHQAADVMVIDALLLLVLLLFPFSELEFEWLFFFQKENTCCFLSSNWIAWKQIIISSPFNYHFHHQIEQHDSTISLSLSLTNKPLQCPTIEKSIFHAEESVVRLILIGCYTWHCYIHINTYLLLIKI